MNPQYRIFRPGAQARFISRPNRFVIRAEIDGTEVNAHCPNPGRMRELLIPGRSIILEKSTASGRKTPWTLAAVVYGNRTVPLISSRSNEAAGVLLLPDLHPGYQRSAEKRLGNSRIDWYLERNGHDIWVEVKACTLVEHSLALFPDAPSERAVRHLGELESAENAEVVFTVMNSDARRFSANPHTDPAFALALARSRDRGVGIRAVRFDCDRNGWLRLTDENLPIDWRSADLAAADSGAVLKLWKCEDKGEVYRLETAICKVNLSKRSRSRRKLSGLDSRYQLVGTFPIRGDSGAFRDFPEKIRDLYGGTASLDDSVFLSEELWSDPVREERFLDLLLDYRHRRVFSL